MNIVTYTVMTGGYDTIKPQDYEGEFICFTDSLDPVPSPWKKVEIRDYSGISKKVTSRLPKIVPHRFIDAEYSLYIDATCTLKIPPEEAKEKFLNGGDRAVFRHPDRSCIYDEADTCVQMGIISRQEADRQMQSYREVGYPRGNHLYACGVILRKHTQQTKEVDELWWRQVAAYCYRDQLSLPYVLWRLGLPEPDIIPGHCYSNAWFQHSRHGGSR